MRGLSKAGIDGGVLMTSTEVIKRKIELKRQLILLTEAEIEDLEAELRERELEEKNRG